ncbi:hypothetical protein BDV24DRAFT_157005 [Aspergillus arachidicola]|uniref:Major facilitator superfamily (MFS) profile domain-containing protein n=1 Tax=Aspergillus arachidicola TaxID=656916 RepID=A0A5N6XLQ1_9EURO|nr:hypothetical protein BDV24DRAFT_157005 [Aspergillus arachidicola]
MNLELGLENGNRYSIIILIFFIPYVVFQPLMTVITRKVGPSYFLGGMIILWGAVLVGMGFAKSWKHMAVARALLGLFEAGYFPGCIYLLSSWYTRFDVQKRFAVFYLIGCVASSLSGILAFALSQIDGLQGLAGWRWIFIVEGIITGVVGILSVIFLVDFPNRAHKSWGFLNEKECAFIVRRINRDRSDGNEEPFSFERFLSPSCDAKIWGFALIFFCTTTVTYAIAYFLPIILKQGMGFSTAASQCLVAPPFVMAGIIMYASAWIGDKRRVRGIIVTFNSLLCIIGLPMMGFAPSVAIRYIGVFFAVIGANANIPACMAYQANNVRGQWTRAFSSTTLVGAGGIGGIVSGLVFRPEDAPGYRLGIWAAIACNILIIIAVAALSLKLRKLNREAECGERVGGSPEFRYTL